MPEPLRIGVLGASRIAREAIVEPAHELGHRLVAVAARDRARATTFATEHGIERVADDYAALATDPEIDLVYVGLINSGHAAWTIAALEAGKDVLCEKPLTTGPEEAARVADAARASGRRLYEAFHHLHHPSVGRLRELVVGGELGRIEQVEITLAIPAPPDDDPRWSAELGGGASADLGCYVISALRAFGSWTSGEPQLITAAVTPWRDDSRVDAAVSARFRFPDGVLAAARWDMAAAGRTMTWTVTGSDASATLPAFGVPGTDPRVIITRDGVATPEQVGSRSSYTEQLAAVVAARRGAPFPLTVDDSVATATLLAACRGA